MSGLTHQALDTKCPAEVYIPATRLYRGLAELDYPFYDSTMYVTNCGRILSPPQEKINLRTVFAGQGVGIKEVEEGIGRSALWITISGTSIWRKKLQPLDNPFGPKVLPKMSLANAQPVK